MMKMKIFNLIITGCLMLLGIMQNNLCITISGAALFWCATYNFVK